MKAARLLMLFLGVLVLAGVVWHLPTPGTVRADEVEELQKQIDELENLKQQSESATKPLESEIASLEKKIRSARAGVESAKKEAVELAESIDDRELDLAVQYEMLTLRIADQYKKARTFSPLMLVIASQDAANITKDLAYRNSVKAQDNKLVQSISSDIVQLEKDKQTLEQNQVLLANLQKQLDSQQAFFEEEVLKAKVYQNDLAGQIAALSARQQEIIAARSGGFTVSGDGELSDDSMGSINNFNATAPAGYFGVFSFGAYSHRNGMSQYGALGRAKSGQSYQQILSAYYPGSTIQTDYPAMDQITVSGVGSGSFEDWYLLRIYEVPASWPKEVLKVQAIAARTYAIRHTNNGQSSICTTEACQVFKNEPKGGAWAEAVAETRGMVLTNGGSPVLTQFASTHGGFTRTAGWDTTDGGGGSDLLTKAYERIGGSPWLYKAWWRQGYSSSGATCGRSSPWLSPEEMADIVNAYVVMKNGTGEELERVTPVTTSCWGGNPYSMSELRDVASKYGGIASAGSVSVSQGEGATNNVTISGVSMSGSDFCKAFNVRAPGNLRIPQWSGSPCGGAFFNVERK
ncbi:hypothetical protein KC686_01210 [Candidatus Woesebacteria bacterium]|nr:hypothetical protein [Candidatus Woesebacteria bacterium]